MNKLRINLLHIRAMTVFALFAIMAPQLYVDSGASPTVDDDRAKVLLEQMAATMHSAKTLEAQMEIVYTRTDKLTGPRVEHNKGSIRLRKPNFAYAVTSGDMYQLLASDGKSRWSMFGDQSTYVKKNASSDGRNLSFHMGFLVNYFFTQNADIYASKGQISQKLRYVGRGEVDGTTTDIVELTSAISKTEEPATLTFHIGPDHLLRRSIIRHNGERVDLVYDTTYLDIRIDRELPVDSFAYAPPKGSQPFQSQEPTYKLLSVGKIAPGFSLPTPNKGTISLAGVRGEARAVIINFWFYG